MFYFGQGKPTGNGKKFNPGFPVTCPFVTAVGATQINPGSTVNDPEGACEQVIFSGGGFSNIFPMPSYQAEAVSSFLTNHPPPFTAVQFNNSGTVNFHDTDRLALFYNSVLNRSARSPIFQPMGTSRSLVRCICIDVP